MDPLNDLELSAILKNSVPAANTELQHDLWLSMLRRMEKGQDAVVHSVPWFDWVLLGAMAASVVFMPQMVPMLLYHL